MHVANPEPGSRTRIPELDVLRGLAILGILFIHLPWMGNIGLAAIEPKLIGWSAWDRIAYAILVVPFEGTFRGLLELTFGAGAVIMLRNTARRDGAVGDADVYLRRCLLLILFGILHSTLLLQSGDILFAYGVVGLLVFHVRNLPPRTMLILGALLLSISAVTSLSEYQGNLELEARVALIDKGADTSLLSQSEKNDLEAWQQLTARPPGRDEEISRERDAILGDYHDNLEFALSFWDQRIKNLTNWHYMLVYVEVLATFMIGMALFRTGFLTGMQSTRTYLSVAILGYSLGFLIRGLELNLLVSSDFSPGVSNGLNPFLPLYELARMSITFAHAALLMLLLRSSFGRYVSVLTAPGRMALSIYFAQTFICMWFLFPGFGLGLWGRFGWAELFLLGIAISVGLTFAARTWLKFHAMGPFEWILRTGSRMALPELQLARAHPR